MHQLKADKALFTLLLICLFIGSFHQVIGQEYWHDIPRKLRYSPSGQDFVIDNGERRFNRALYGYHSDFRTEAGDQPLFSFYLPGMGGHFRFGVQVGDQSKWLHEAADVTASYRAGMMVYSITDPLLGKGEISISVMPLREQEGAIFNVESEGLPAAAELIWVYGGVTGKRFRRMGDLGADPPSVFDLTVEKCQGNEIRLNGQNELELMYGEAKDGAPRPKMLGTFPLNAEIRSAAPQMMDSPAALWESTVEDAPVLVGKVPAGNAPHYFAIYRPGFQDLPYQGLAEAYSQADEARKQLANRIQVKTPDPYINTVGGALGIAADAIYDAPAYVHGAVAWRMPLPGWRGAYVADWMGWHDRAKTHFDGYLASQYLEPGGSRNDPDTAKHLARQMEKTGKSIFNRGYISRRPGEPSSPHHYDMNQVFFDQLIRHFDWTGDVDYLKEVWPSIERHLAWEKRNFDPDGDGLYNAYASIWASDALQYNSGGVAHASAYNYFANKKAAELASFIGEDGEKYETEADRILQAMNGILWLPDGWYAEYKDFLGPENVHPQAGVWSIYHTIDSEVPDPFQAWQMTRYVDTQIPHIPLTADGLEEGKYHTLSTTIWMPYTWSVNNVALAEVLHTSLAYWQAGNSDEAFRLWKSALLESMYLGGSPGNFQQLSFLDAMRSELYRDFADAVGMGARSLIEGLFGVKPDLMNDRLEIVPGFPAEWEYASLSTPDVTIDFKQKDEVDHYEITNRFGKELEVELVVRARSTGIKAVKVNGKPVAWSLLENQVGKPAVLIKAPLGEKHHISIAWKGAALEDWRFPKEVTVGESLVLDRAEAEVLKLQDPEQVLAAKEIADGGFQVKVASQMGNKTFFAKLKQGEMTWWEPIAVKVLPRLEITPVDKQSPSALAFSVTNHQKEAMPVSILVNGKPWKAKVSLISNKAHEFTIQALPLLQTGTNLVEVYHGDELVAQQEVINWELDASSKSLETVDISSAMNDKVTAIFRNEYLSPRSPYPTLQIPVQGMGDWASHGAYMDINDEGLRKLAGERDQFVLPQGIPFSTPGDAAKNNILFASYWDNYPEEVKVPLSGKANHAYLLMAGSTNHMQSRMENGQVVVHYKDGSEDILSLRNPESWWPIEQDYYIDGYAFDIGVPRPVRVHLKTGKISREAHDQYEAIDHFTEHAIDGGAATVLDLPLDPEKELDYLEVKATTIEVVIGLMAVTLERE
ncbi:glycogen debranching protein [Echinicola strongylocentroti]|uniref:Glycogen debranching protein n=1 Tax=Echinicola strongylocentroti TaxID=1795355 RepID=A0A2Z4IK84_9BACT|nr:DUF4450 domain-containing protein [Echinicola strongylocentroti]AWW31157.1 glycogen debranching protein [Echinicola strongylocentroti]